MDNLYRHIVEDVDKNKDKDRDDIDVRSKLRNSFTACYLILFGTALITFIEAMRTDSAPVRHILNLETAVSLTAGFVYSMFEKIADDESKPFDLHEITYYRYVDWMITTPMLLLVLVLFLTFHTNAPLHFSYFIIILILNYIMLWCGYNAEKQKQRDIGIHRDTKIYKDKTPWSTLGFVAFAAMIAMIFYLYLGEEKDMTSSHMIMFYIFTTVWAMYGVAAEMDQLNKNMMYNVLDMIAKVFFGLGLWCYYGDVIQW